MITQKILNDILLKVIEQANRLNIPISQNIEKHVYIDSGINNRAGFCKECYDEKFKKYNLNIVNKYEIHITDKVLNYGLTSVENILAHEILHSCFMCKNHSYPWSSYAKAMNNEYGYNIKSIYNNWEEMK